MPDPTHFPAAGTDRVYRALSGARALLGAVALFAVLYSPSILTGVAS